VSDAHGRGGEGLLDALGDGHLLDDLLEVVGMAF
jgi:hypothetical protein